MKYLMESFLLLAVAAAAAPLKAVHEQDHSDHSPAAAAFKKGFRTFVGRSDEDVEKFMVKAQKTTHDFIEAAANETREIFATRSPTSPTSEPYDESLDKIVERNQNAAELATIEETRLKRERNFAGEGYEETAWSLCKRRQATGGVAGSGSWDAAETLAARGATSCPEDDKKTQALSPFQVREST